MLAHKLRIAGFAAASLIAPTVLPAEQNAPATPPPVLIGEPHREYLSRVARRTVQDAGLPEKPYEPAYVPEGLATLSAEAVVRLRHHGYLFGVGVGGPGSIVRATRDAALAACGGLPKGQFSRLDKDEWLIEIEVLGSAVALPSGIDWTQPSAVEPFIEPGVDGLLVIVGEATRRVCPSEIVASESTIAEAAKLLAQGLQLTAGQIARTPLMRFRTAHWYEPSASRSIVSLHRGLTLVSPNAVSAAGLKEAIDRIAEYMVYRQRSTGLFSYQFEPGADRFSDEDNVVRQAGATMALAVHAQWSGRSASLAAADAAVANHLQGISALPSASGASFIATGDGKNKLGVTAMLALALAQHPDAARFETTRQRLLAGMLTLQRPSGMFMTAFPPAIDVRGQDYFPGEALLALADEYDRRPSPAILEAFDRAIDFYRDYFDASRSAAFVSWQVQAFALMAKHTKRKDYNDYVFALTDHLAAKQLTSANCAWPELHGAIAGPGSSQAGASTASYLEAFTDALVLASTIGDAERVRRYEGLVRDAARFVIQLQVRPEEAYFIRSPQDAVGGIRAAPALNKLRIDHCQHALVALIKAREALFPTDG